MHLPRLYPLLDTQLLAARGLPVIAAAEAMLDAGARILQLRHKAFFGRVEFAWAERIADLCREVDAQFVLNDRSDLAVLVDAGLHVGQDDLPPTHARVVAGPNRCLGLSTHNEQQVRDAASEPVDYLAFGPVYGTASKRNPDPVTGVDQLRHARTLTDRPLVAIGGVTRANALAALEAGADSVAVISDLIPDVATSRFVRARTVEWLQLLAR